MAVIEFNFMQMKKITSRRNLLILSMILIGLIVANAIIFVPHFIRSKQMLTEAELRQHQQTLSRTAYAASELVARQSGSAPRSQQLADDLQPLGQSVDEVILDLRTTAHPVNLDKEARETLRLAEILSFTLRNTATKGAGDSLTAVKTAQILKQSAKSVDKLPQAATED